MDAIEILKVLDKIAQQANALWCQCETLKMRIAEREHISSKRMKENGIFLPEK